MSKLQTGGGAFDREAGPSYFLATIASGIQCVAADLHDHLLIAINELHPASLEVVAGWMASGRKVLLDSGIFWLTNAHKRAHKLSMDEALALAPEEIDGFPELWDRYVTIMRAHGDASWGYIELDQGGRDNKIKTRARLEALGLRPIPVYHPLNDGWDYFDDLCQRYDRICFGNVVQADQPTRARLIATAWERHRKYPDVWIHLLGYTPNQLLYAFPVSSADSSSWLSALRWDGYKETAGGKTLSHMPMGFRYAPDAAADVPGGYGQAIRMAAYGAHMVERNWRNHITTWRALGCPPYPPPA